MRIADFPLPELPDAWQEKCLAAMMHCAIILCSLHERSPDEGH